MQERGRVYSKNRYKRPMDIDNRVRIDSGNGWWAGKGRAKGENWDNCNRTIVKKRKKKAFTYSLEHVIIWKKNEIIKKKRSTGMDEALYEKIVLTTQLENISMQPT